MEKNMRILAVILVLMIVIGLAGILIGCDGSGGMGGQGLSFKDITVAAGGHFEVKVDIDDGGTFTNPSVSVDREPTTQPSK